MQKGLVVGFAFNADRSKVVLIRKNHPEEQAGLLNGVGGGIEEDDLDALHTMLHEFRSEAGLITSRHDWRYVTTFKNKKEKDVTVYCASSDYFMNAQTTAQDDPTKTEDIFIFDVQEVLQRTDFVFGTRDLIRQSLTILAQ